MTGPLAAGIPGAGTRRRGGGGRTSRGVLAAAWVAVLLVTAGVRVPAALAGRPYISYADEGNYLHRVVHLLATGGWDTGYYLYPTVPMYSVAAAARLYSPIYRAVHGHPLTRDLSPDPPFAYDFLEPPELLYIGRAFAVALSLGIVLLAGALAHGFAGRRAGLVAGWLAALTPALVIRGGIANVDIFATFFVLAALVAVERLRDRMAAAASAETTRERGTVPSRGTAAAGATPPAVDGATPPAVDGATPPAADGGAASTAATAAAVAAGALSGLAATSKYTSALVFLPVALAIVLAAPTSGRRLRLLALAGGAAALASVVAMPGFVLRTGAVLRDLHTQSSLYSTIPRGSYWQQAFVRAEWDQPLAAPEVGIAYTLLAALGLLAALADRRQARAAAGWLLFAAALGVVLAPYEFRPFRNLLPVVPLMAVLVGLLYARLRRAVDQPARAAVHQAERGVRAAGLALDLAAALLPLVLFGSTVLAYDAGRLQVRDSRALAVEWLAAHSRRGDAVLVASELMILPLQLDSLQARSVVTTWPSWRQLMRDGACRFAVTGNFALPGQPPHLLPQRFWRNLLGLYEIRASFGDSASVASDSFYVSRDNRQAIYVLERRAPAVAASPAETEAAPPTRSASR